MKVLVMGAGVYQYPLIQKAKEMGLYTIVASCDGHYPGFEIADKVCKIDTRDIGLVCQLADREEICGIVTTGTDVAVRTVGEVCDRLNLCGISREASIILTDKAKMKIAFDGVISTADYVIVHSYDEALDGASTLGYPVMLKVVDSSGSRGIYKVLQESDLEDAWKRVNEISLTDHFILEKYIDGVEIGVDAFVSNRELKAFFPHDKINLHIDDVCIPAGHIFPSSISAAVSDQIKRQLEMIISSINLDNCAINCDIIIENNEKAMFLEIGGRCGATCIPELIYRYSGVDYYEQIIRCAIGDTTDFSIKWNRPAIARLIFAQEGGMVKHINQEKILSISASNNVDIKLDVKQGDYVRRVRNGADRIGQIIGDHKDANEMKTIEEMVLNCITIS